MTDITSCICGDYNLTADKLCLKTTTNSTSTSTGALVMLGGAGIACDAWIGGDINVAGDMTVSGTLTCNTVQSATVYTATQNTNATSGVTGSLIACSGGLGVKCDAYIEGHVISESKIYTENTTNATTTTDGSIQTDGGISVVCDIKVGGNVTADCFIGDGSNLTGITGGSGTGYLCKYSGHDVCYCTDGTLTITNTTQSTSSTTGAFMVSGGVGIACNAHIGGTLVANTLCISCCLITTASGTFNINAGNYICLNAAGETRACSPIGLAVCTVTALNALGAPSAGAIAYACDATDGSSNAQPTPVFYDGTNWLRFDTRATVVNT